VIFDKLLYLPYTEILASLTTPGIKVKQHAFPIPRRPGLNQLLTTIIQKSKKGLVLMKKLEAKE
jgi:hypothetical protein